MFPRWIIDFASHCLFREVPILSKFLIQSVQIKSSTAYLPSFFDTKTGIYQLGTDLKANLWSLACINIIRSKFIDNIHIQKIYLKLLSQL